MGLGVGSGRGGPGCPWMIGGFGPFQPFVGLGKSRIFLIKCDAVQ